MQDAVRVMAQHDIGSLVVMDRGRYAGMLTFREVLDALAKHGGSLGDLKSGDIYQRDALTAPPGLDVMELRRAMLERHARYVLNTESSIRRIKGKGRPINANADRAAVLAGLASVDYVCFFGANTPARLIAALVPDVPVKGADWETSTIVGKDVVEAAGGRVRRIRLTPGRSTTSTIEKILRVYGRTRIGG